MFHKPQLPAPAGTGRMLQLDGLRALAILGVMLHHFGVKPAFWFDWGPVAPTVFFMLSGYLITISLMKMRDRGAATAEGLLGYHMRRIARLTPALYLLLILGAVLGLAEYQEGFFWHALFLSNVQMGLTGEWSGSLSHLWSLAKQEQFYLLWPFLLLLPRRWIVPAMWVAVGSALVFRIACMQLGATEMFRWMMLLGSLDAFAVGGLLAMAYRNYGTLIPRGWAVPAVAIAVGCWLASRFLRLSYGTFLTPFVEIFEVICFGILIAVLIQYPQNPLARILSSTPLALLGKISYGLFIWHVMVVLALGPHLNRIGLTMSDAPLASAAIFTVASIILASLSWVAIERPSIAWAKAIESSGVATTIVECLREALTAARGFLLALASFLRPKA